jgi:transcriptional regulator with XRE-family HTH domain
VARASNRTEPADDNGTVAPIDEVRTSIGARIAHLRMEHGYSIRALAELADLSPSLISNAERGKVEPSIATLRRLSEALGTSPTYFVAAAHRGGPRVVRAGERGRVEPASQSDAERGDGRWPVGVEVDRVTPESAHALEAWVARLDPEAVLDLPPLAEPGETWGMILSGRLKVWAGDEFQFLGPGDAIWHHADVAQRIENFSREAGEILWVHGS